MAIARIQVANDTSGAAAVPVPSWLSVWPVSPTEGSFLVLFIVSRIDDAAPVIPTVMVSQAGVNWSFVSRETSATGGALFGVVMDAYYGLTTGDPIGTNIRINYLNTPTVGCSLFAEYTGVNLQSPLDVFAGQSGASTPIPSGSTAFTSQNDELWLASWCSENTRNEPSAASNGFSLIASTNLSEAIGFPDMPGEPSIGLGENIVTQRGIASSDATTSDPDRNASVVVTYKAGGPFVFPSAPEPKTTSSVIPNTDYVGQGLDRLAQQFQSGD